MITASNYLQKIEQYENFEKSLPANLKEGHQYIIEFGDLYNEDPTIKEVIDLYLKRLNEFLKVTTLKSDDEIGQRLKEVNANVQEGKKWLKEYKKSAKDHDCGCDGKPEEHQCEECKDASKKHFFTKWEEIKPDQVVMWDIKGKATPLIHVGQTKTFATPNRRSYPKPNIKSLRKPLENEQIIVNKAIEQAFNDAAAKAHPQYKPDNSAKAEKYEFLFGKDENKNGRDFGKELYALGASDFGYPFANGLEFTVKAGRFLVFDNAGEFKLDRITKGKEEYLGVIYFKIADGQKEYTPKELAVKVMEAAEYHATAETNCQVLDSDGKPDISEPAIKSLEKCVSNLPQTKELVMENGKYTKSRLKIHDAIISEIKDNKPCITQREPVAVLTGGPPGSGKSTWLKKYAKWISSSNVYHIDADEVRAKLPEYKGWNATQTHLETKDIVNRLIDEIGTPCQFDLVYDGTMNKATSYQPLIDRLKGLGYKIFIIYISVPKEVSRKRALERYRTRGRYVPMNVIDEVYANGLSAFEKLAKEADGFIRVDGESGKLIEKGGMPIPKSERYAKAKEDCKVCDPTTKRETQEERELRLKNAQQFIKDLQSQGEKLKAMTDDQIIKIGLEFQEKYRPKGSITRDKSHDSVKRLSPSPENLIRWMKHPGNFDLIGVDTFQRIDPTADYKKEISKQKFWNNVFGIKI